MRRSEREITDRALIDDIIRRAQVCRLGLLDGELPYIVPLSFGYDGQTLYFHCAPQGRKLDLIRRQPRVCFEFDIMENLIEAAEACHWGVRYQSVMGTGTAEIVADAAGKRQALAAVMAHYAPGGTYAFPDAAIACTGALRVTIESIAGKQSAR
jgi:nitroimidazol reductase NimA-like FMN-containing flavoprotein (pyridoxamine 5'-phosphate oxidase superfamily)